MMTRLSYKIHFEKLDDFIKILEKAREKVDKKKFLSDIIIQGFILRNLQQACEVVLNTGEMLITDFGFRKPQKNDEIFEILGEGKVISKGLAIKMKKMGGFRNILVHDYVNLDLNIAYINLVEGLPNFKQFKKEVAKSLLGKMGKFY